MAMYDDPEQQKEYDEAMAKLEAGEKPTTSRGPDGKFTAAEEKPAEAEVAKEAESEVPKAEAVEPAKEEVKPAEPDPLEALRAEIAKRDEELAKRDKALKDTQAWATKNAQELAAIRREKELQQRAASRPQILEQNPELEQAIRHVVTDPTPQIQQEKQQQEWFSIIDRAHPGIFAPEADPELINALVAKRDAPGSGWEDPLIAIRDITAEKLAYTERQTAKKLKVEAEQRAQKSAMSVPGAGATVPKTAKPSDQDEAKRIQSMSPAEFEKERKRVLGY